MTENIDDKPELPSWGMEYPEEIPEVIDEKEFQEWCKRNDNYNRKEKAKH